MLKQREREREKNSTPELHFGFYATINMWIYMCDVCVYVLRDLLCVVFHSEVLCVVRCTGRKKSKKKTFNAVEQNHFLCERKRARTHALAYMNIHSPLTFTSERTTKNI